MGRVLVAKYTCSRCTREWYVEFDKGTEPPDPPALDLTLTVSDGELLAVSYPELCPSCAKTVSNYVENISRQLTHKSPERGAKKEEEGSPSSSEDAAD